MARPSLDRPFLVLVEAAPQPSAYAALISSTRRWPTLKSTYPSTILPTLASPAPAASTMPPKAKGKGKKPTRTTSASQSKSVSRPQTEPETAPATRTETEPRSEPQVPELPQDENEELSFEDHIQSTPKKQPPPKARRAAAQESESQSRPRGDNAPEDELADESVDTPGASRKGQRRRGRVSDSVRTTGEEVESIEGSVGPLHNTTGTHEARRQAGQKDSQRKSASDSTGNAKSKASAKLRPSRPLGPKGRKQTNDAPEPAQQRRRKPPSQQISEAPHSDSTKRSAQTTTLPSRHAASAHPQEEPVSSSKKRRRTEVDARNPPPPPSPPRKYRRIAPRNLTIPRTKVEESWTPLPTASITIASSLLHLAERPILQGLSNPKRRNQAAQALRVVSKHLTRRLTRNFPFPPALSQSSSSNAARRTSGGPNGNGNKKGPKPVVDPRDEELDFDRCVAATQSLERTQDTLLHGNQLLRAELAREEAALERDYADLDSLETNARSEIRGLRDGLRKAHPLVPQPQPQPQSLPDGQTTLAESRARQEATFRVGGPEGEGRSGSDPLFHGLDHPELSALPIQVASHVESMRTNLRPIADVFPEITRSRAALRDVLAKYLDTQQYDDVILG
ncbi:hypothetical protein SODALDRAFT_319124 [Sodiomyces alkalinus F11]|uniref:Kinetochore protein fta7 n=1 Tax=Sodiomyces alkalinus (strain CBS 110278 / VKM F-3762 / F11) TaxID=1314773 RepID=A0A3N2Q6N5_SODAK|nr:hypothetical protein SODALDRAFT_319124 [Sodiomyces alkalinus F11]ROT42443.1 hypothetical protein SODALDRAFT_319124 [Sodiomyces alkalinus F11]